MYNSHAEHGWSVSLLTPNHVLPRCPATSRAVMSRPSSTRWRSIVPNELGILDGRTTGNFSPPDMKCGAPFTTSTGRSRGTSYPLSDGGPHLANAVIHPPMRFSSLENRTIDSQNGWSPPGFWKAATNLERTMTRVWPQCRASLPYFPSERGWIRVRMSDQSSSVPKRQREGIPHIKDMDGSKSLVESLMSAGRVVIRDRVRFYCGHHKQCGCDLIFDGRGRERREHEFSKAAVRNLCGD